MLKKGKCNKKIWGYICIVLTVLIYSMNYFRNTFPLSEGWFVNYVELVEHGKLPYRDFFYYLPPLNLLIDYCFWKLSFGYLLIFRFWYVVERIVIYCLMYRLLSKYYDSKKVAIACSIASVLCTADDFDFFGDYNQTVALLAVVLLSVVVRFFKFDDIKGKCTTLFWAGVTMGFMVFCKPTIPIASGIVYFVALIIICLQNKDKNILKYSFSTIIGGLIPVGIASIILAVNGALLDFIDQVFLSVDGKGSIFDILVSYILLVLTDWKCWVAAIIVGLIMFAELTMKDKQRDFWISSLGLTLCAYVINALSWNLITNYVYSISIIVKMLFIIVAVVIAFCYKQHKSLGAKVEIAIFIWGIVTCIWVMCDKNIYHAIYDTQLYSNISLYMNDIIFFFVILLAFFFGKQRKKNEYMIENIDEKYIISIGAISLCYANSMAAGLNYMASNALRIATPFMITIILTKCKSKYNLIFKYLVIMVLVVAMTVCIAQKSVNAYPWWGMKNVSKEYKIYTVDNIESMRGISFSKEDKVMYESITKIIDDNTDEDAIILGYPYLKIYNIICDRYNSYSVPVFWFDVVGDKYVNKLYDEIQEKLPDVILWYEIPGSLEAHEKIYRNGKPLMQRKIIDYIQAEIPEKYDYMGTYNDISVYILKKQKMNTRV